MPESKNLFSESWLEGTKTKGLTYSQTLSAILDKVGGEVLQALRRCRWWSSAPGTTRLVFLGRFNSFEAIFFLGFSSFLGSSWFFCIVLFFGVFCSCLYFSGHLNFLGPPNFFGLSSFFGSSSILGAYLILGSSSILGSLLFTVVPSRYIT